MRHIFLASALLGTLSSPLPADPLEQYFAPSAYGCRNLQADPQTPILEGKDGVFYRVYADIRMQHPCGRLRFPGESLPGRTARRQGRIHHFQCKSLSTKRINPRVS